MSSEQSRDHAFRQLQQSQSDGIRQLEVQQPGSKPGQAGRDFKEGTSHIPIQELPGTGMQAFNRALERFKSGETGDLHPPKKTTQEFAALFGKPGKRYTTKADPPKSMEDHNIPEAVQEMIKGKISDYKYIRSWVNVDQNSEQWRNRVGDDDFLCYEHCYDPITGIFIDLDNQRKLDEEIGPKAIELPPNSEVIRNHCLEVDGKKLTEIISCNVIDQNTSDVMSDFVEPGEKKTFSPGDAGYRAALKTTFPKRARYILRDHGEHFDIKEIASIEMSRLGEVDGEDYSDEFAYVRVSLR